MLLIFLSWNGWGLDRRGGEWAVGRGGGGGCLWGRDEWWGGKGPLPLLLPIMSESYCNGRGASTERSGTVLSL